MSDHVTELTAANFDQVVTANPITIIDFWAPWCGPCKAFAPTFEAAAADHSDVKFVKVNTDQEQELAGHFKIRSIPTLMIIRDSVVVFNQAGMLSKSQLADVLQKTKALDMAQVKGGASPS